MIFRKRLNLIQTSLWERNYNKHVITIYRNTK